MSIRGRMLLIVIALNLLVLGVLQLAQALLVERWRSEHRQVYEGYFGGILRDAYAPERRSHLARLRALLELDTFRGVFRDVLVTNGRTPEAAGFVDLNPMGALRRDHRVFPLQEVRAGIRQAMDARALVSVGDGFCVPIASGEEVVAGAWFRPHLPPTPHLPPWITAAALVVGSLSIVLLARWAVERSVTRPLQSLADAAARVGAGDFGVRVPPLPAGHELAPFVAQFNAMAARVAGHTQELDAAVQRATQEASRRERALVLSGRLAAIGTLAAGIAHEINNPIGGMLNAARRLLERPDLDARQRQYLELIQEGLGRVGVIARRVLDFSPKKVEPAPFAVAAAVESARALVEHRLVHDGVELRVDLPPGLPRLQGDQHEIQQVLLNILINALDVLVGRPAPRLVSIQGRALDGRVELLVEDNGPGMAKADLGRVFDPFFTAKGKADATGLGMFICYSIVQNHGGSIELDSEPGAGFRVRILLPSA